LQKLDPYLGLLNARNTPSEGLNSSPAQRLLGRRTKTLLPTTAELLKPNSAPSIKEQVKLKEIQKNHIAVRMNASRKDLKPLKPGDIVRMQPIKRGEKEWKPATVTKQLKQRTYEVKTNNGNLLRRNRQHLRFKPHGERPPPEPKNSNTHGTVANYAPNLSMPPVNKTCDNSENMQKPVAATDKLASAKPTPNPIVNSPDSKAQPANEPSDYIMRRSGRVSKPPIRFSDM
jgi:hypothetical protein